MEPFQPFIVNLYWGGSVYYSNGNITCDTNTRRSSIVVRQKLCFDDFLTICYQHVDASRDTEKLSLNLLDQFQGNDFTSEILNDDSLETLYYLATLSQPYWGHVWVKREPIVHLQTPQFMNQFQNFSFANDAAETGYAQPHYNPPYAVALSVDLPAPAPSSYAHDTHPPEDNKDGSATVGGFELMSDDCSSEHSSRNQDSSPIASDDDDDDSEDFNEGYVPETCPTTQAGMMITQNQQTGHQELPEWADDDHLDMWSASSGVIRCGMYFKGKKELDQAVRMWNIGQGRQTLTVQSKSHVYEATCYSKNPNYKRRFDEPDCRWFVRASDRNDTQMWRIYKWVNQHNCYGGLVRNNNRSLTSKLIATHIAHFIKENVALPVKQVQAHIKRELKVDVSYQKAWHGRKKAIEGLYGSWESNFAELPMYIDALQRSNPNTVVQWKHHDDTGSQAVKFKYVFWAFGPAIEAFQLCLPVICVDGTHLKGSYRGKLLTAVTKDANNHVLPIAYAIVDEETNESWSWFLELFWSFVACRHNKPLCVVSDRHHSIINAMETLDHWKEPYAYHRFCLRHVRSNLMSRFRDSKLKKLCWVLGSTTQRRKFIVYQHQLQTINPEAWNYLDAIGLSKWTLVHDINNRRWGNLTTNIAESMNNALRVARLLPIRACIDHTFNRTVAHFRKHIELAMSCEYMLPPRMWQLFLIREGRAQEHTVTEFDYIEQIYRVVSVLTTNERGDNDYNVRYKSRKCSCGKWQMTRFPCSHAIAVCQYRGDDVHDIINKVYKTSTYKRQYRCDFQPLPHKGYWVDPGWKIRADSSRLTTARGRRRTRRIRNEMDERDLDAPRVRKCAICKQPGHTRTRCPNSQPTFN